MEYTMTRAKMPIIALYRLECLSAILLIVAVLLSGNLYAAGDDSAALEADIEALKKEVLSLNRDLFILEEDLLFPANTQFSIFLSIDSGHFFKLDSVEIKVNDKMIASHLYTERELSALLRGGVQRLYIGNLPSGEHEVVALFTGFGPNNREYRRGKTIVIEKSGDPQFIEFSIKDDVSKEQPEFDARIWE
jgi:hypothetical protein